MTTQTATDLRGIRGNGRLKKCWKANETEQKWPQTNEKYYKKFQMPVGKDEVGGSNPPISSISEFFLLPCCDENLIYKLPWRLFLAVIIIPKSRCKICPAHRWDTINEPGIDFLCAAAKYWLIAACIRWLLEALFVGRTIAVKVRKTYSFSSLRHKKRLRHKRSGHCSCLHQNFRISSHAGGHWFESSSLHQKVPDFVRNQELFHIFLCKKSASKFDFCVD